jgi:C4-dicarboxylate-specific signal transduction histidine kinase
MVHRIARIIKALKNFSRNSEYDPPVESRLSEVLTLGLDLCRERFRVGSIDLQVELNVDPMVLCRPTEISQVLLNLLNNAYDAVQGGQAPLVRISTELCGDSLEVLIQDNGPGIPQHLRDKIMQPFFTTKDVDKGTGLGLSISKGLIEGHQGKLSLLENEKLTTFQILLPLQKELAIP